MTATFQREVSSYLTLRHFSLSAFWLITMSQSHLLAHPPTFHLSVGGPSSNPALDLCPPTTLSASQSQSLLWLQFGCAHEAQIFFPCLNLFLGPGLYIWLPYCYCWHDSQILKLRISLTEFMIHMPPTCCQTCLSALHAALSPPFSLTINHLAEPATNSPGVVPDCSLSLPSNQILSNLPLLTHSLLHATYSRSQLLQLDFTATTCYAPPHVHFVPSWIDFPLCSQSGLLKMPVPEQSFEMPAGEQSFEYASVSVLLSFAFRIKL